MAAEVPVATVVDALELLPAEREAVLDVDRLLGVVRQLVRRVLTEAEALLGHAVVGVPRPAAREPLLEDARRVTGRDEVLHLHLLELAHPEDEVAGRDLVAKALADLGDAEGQLLARRLLDVLEVDVAALRGLGAQVDDGCVLLDRAHEGLEHQVEATRRTERTAVDGALEAEALDDVRIALVGLGQVFRARQLVEAEAQLVSRALHQRVAERLDVARRDPHLGMHQDARVETDDVVAQLDHLAPPGTLDIVLELDAERAIVPNSVYPAIDLGAGEDKTAPLGERDDGVERVDGRRGIIRRVGCPVGGDGQELTPRGAGHGTAGRGGHSRTQKSPVGSPAGRLLENVVSFATAQP